jgi:hypothetical protein
MAKRKAPRPEDTALPEDTVVTAGDTREREERSTEQRSSDDKVRSFMALARQRFAMVMDGESQLRAEMLDDLEFRGGEMWDAATKQNRIVDKRPCLTIDRISAPIRHVTNSQREASPTLRISPVDSGADVKTATVLEGIVRHIEVSSSAKVAYDTAFEHAVTMGRGYIIVRTEWDDDMAWTQRISIDAVQNPFSVALDPSARRPDKRDANWGFVFEDLSDEEYANQYGKDNEASSLEEMRTVGDGLKHWYNSGSHRIAEYWYVDVELTPIVACIDTRNPAEITSVKKAALEAAMQANPYLQPYAVNGVVLEREATIRTVKWAKINGSRILEGNEDKTAGREWAGKYVPIIEVIGDELWIDGRRDLRGIVRSAKDPQRMYNVWVSALTEQIGLAPRTPFIGAKGQFKGLEGRWQQANVRNFSYLEYNAISVDGNLAPPPQRQQFEPPIQAMVYAIRQADNDLKATTMLFDASLGEAGPEQSGKAIIARQQQGQVAHAHFLDNLARSHGFLGIILLDMIPRIYDTPRVMRILGTDNTSKPVTINQPYDDNGIERIHDLGVGKYDVVVAMSRSFMTRRQEAVDSLVRLIEANPQMFPIVGDLMVGMMDFDDAQKIAKRLEKTLPPELQPEQEGNEPNVQAIMAQMQQAKQQIDMLSQAVVEKDDIIRSKKIETASKEYIAALQAQVQAAIAMAQIDSKLGLEQLRGEQQRLSQLLELNNQRVIDEQQAARDDASAASDRAFQMHQSERQHANAMQMQAAAAPPQPGGAA